MTLTLSCAVWESVTVTHVDGITLDNPQLLSLMRATLLMHATVPLVKLDVTVGPVEVDYLIVARDGRRWRQTLKDRSPNPPMTFDHNDAWTKAEFALHRPMRDLVIDLVGLGATRIVMRPR